MRLADGLIESWEQLLDFLNRRDEMSESEHVIAETGYLRVHAEKHQIVVRKEDRPLAKWDGCVALAKCLEEK